MNTHLIYGLRYRKTHKTVKNEDDCRIQVMTVYTAIVQSIQTHLILKVNFQAIGKTIHILYTTSDTHTITVMPSYSSTILWVPLFHEMSLSLKCPIYEMSIHEMSVYVMSIKVQVFSSSSHHTIFLLQHVLITCSQNPCIFSLKK